MGTFSVNAKKQEILKLISSWCHEKNLELTQPLVDNIRNRKKIFLHAQGRRLKFFKKVSWDILVPQKGNCTVRMRISLNGFLKFLYIILFMLIMMWLVSINISSNYIQNIYFQVAPLIIFPVLLIYHILIRNNLIKFEGSFWNNLRYNHKYYQISPIETYIIQPEYLLLVIFPIIFLTFIFLIRYVGVMYSFLMLTFILLLFIPYYYKECFSGWYNKWKLSILELENWWILICFLIILYFSVLSWINCLFVTLEDKPDFYENHNIKEVLPQSISSTMLSRESKYYFRENLEIVNRITDVKVQAFANAKGDEINLENIRKSFYYRLSLLIAPVIFILLFYFYSCKRILDTSQIWAKVQGKQKTKKQIIIPSVYQYPVKNNKTLKAIFIIHYLLGSFFTILACLISLDLLYYMVFQKTFIIEYSGVLISWPFVLLSLIFSPLLSSTIGYLILLIFCIPCILFFINSILRIVKYFRSYVLIVFQKKVKMHLPPNLKRKLKLIDKSINQICNKNNLNPPYLILKRNQKELIQIKGRLLSKKTTLFINIMLLEKFSLKELNALVAHELGHLKQGMRTIEWLKFISAITFFPNYYLTLFIDPVVFEFKADRFSIKNMGESNSLIKSIIKLSIILHNNQYSTKNKKTSTMSQFLKIKGIHESIEFFFGDAILGYTYPILIRRLSYLKGITK